VSLKNLIENKSFVVNTLFMNAALKLNLSLNEFYILMYFDNLINKEFNIEQLVNVLNISESDALISFNKLIEKKLVVVVAVKNSAGKIIEKVNLDVFYSIILDSYKVESKKEKTVDIFNVFEKEFGRTLSSMEYEIINAWLEKSYSEELIIGALKESIYSGVTNLRYIDKILYEWQRKGFKNMQDVNKHLANRSKEKGNQKEELFDYNWLDEDN